MKKGLLGQYARKAYFYMTNSEGEAFYIKYYVLLLFTH